MNHQHSQSLSPIETQTIYTPPHCHNCEFCFQTIGYSQVEDVMLLNAVFCKHPHAYHSLETVATYTAPRSNSDNCRCGPDGHLFTQRSADKGLFIGIGMLYQPQQSRPTSNQVLARHSPHEQLQACAPPDE